MAEQSTMPESKIDFHNHVQVDDVCGERLLKLMDENGIERTMILGTPRIDNAGTLKAVKAHPNRFVGAVYADPREGQAALDEVNRYYDEGMRVVKLFPNLGYYPDDDAFGPLFELIAERGMAVLSHCGFLTPKMGISSAIYSYPCRFEKLIRTFPETPFILAHMGGMNGFLEAIMLATRTPNTYVDCSPGQGVWVWQNAGSQAATIPPERILWGVDCYDFDKWPPLQQTALAAAGMAAHFHRIYRENALEIWNRVGAI